MNSNNGYNTPQNVRYLGSNYLYFGFLPISTANTRTTQGIRVNIHLLTEPRKSVDLIVSSPVQLLIESKSDKLVSPIINLIFVRSVKQLLTHVKSFTENRTHTHTHTPTSSYCRSVIIETSFGSYASDVVSRIQPSLHP